MLWWWWSVAAVVIVVVMRNVVVVCLLYPQFSRGLFLLDRLCEKAVGGRFSLPSTITPCILVPRAVRAGRLKSGPVCSGGMDMVLARGSKPRFPVVRLLVTLGLTSRRLIMLKWLLSMALTLDGRGGELIFLDWSRSAKMMVLSPSCMSYVSKSASVRAEISSTLEMRRSCGSVRGRLVGKWYAVFCGVSPVGWYS